MRWCLGTRGYRAELPDGLERDLPRPGAAAPAVQSGRWAQQRWKVAGCSLLPPPPHRAWAAARLQFCPHSQLSGRHPAGQTPARGLSPWAAPRSPASLPRRWGPRPPHSPPAPSPQHPCASAVLPHLPLRSPSRGLILCVRTTCVASSSCWQPADAGS